MPRWVVHLPVDLTGPDNEVLLAHEERGIKGRYNCVEKITDLPDGRTEWRLVTSSTPAGSIPKSLAENTLPARISLDITSFIDWYYTCYLKPKTFEKDTTLGGSALVPVFPARIALAAIWGPGLYALYKSRAERDVKDIVPKTDRLLIGMCDPMIPATIELGESLSLANATALISARLLTIPRMSHRLVLPTSGTPYWEPCEKVDLGAHVREHTLPSGSGYSELRALLEQLSRMRVDPTRPPWDVSIIHHPENGSNGYLCLEALGRSSWRNHRLT
ncbi:hypothetical protein B0H14DRAFT_2599799 [Mycena olivaceomarginata]|nr:hypothetical protein B0H14DRAFT_2599799 [Mycena olivaceomarginata]